MKKNLSSCFCWSLETCSYRICPTLPPPTAPNPVSDPSDRLGTESSHLNPIQPHLPDLYSASPFLLPLSAGNWKKKQKVFRLSKPLAAESQTTFWSLSRRNTTQYTRQLYYKNCLIWFTSPALILSSLTLQFKTHKLSLEKK